jgi:hypothetical protein
MSEQPLSILDILRSYVLGQKDGATLDYVTVQTETGVAMDRIGRYTLRRACRAEQRPYLTIRDCGIRLSSAESANEFVRRKTEDVARLSARKMVEQKRVFSRHESEMTESGRQQALREICVLASVRQASMHSTALLPAQPEPRADPSERMQAVMKIFK